MTFRGVIHNGRRPSGMSLVEVLAALALAGVVAGTSLLGYSRMLSQWGLNAAAPQRLLGDGPHVCPADGPPTALPDTIQAVACTANGASITFQPRGHASTFGT